MKGKTVKHLLYRWRQKIVPYGKIRHSTQYVKEQNGTKKLNVCELGVSSGYNARNILLTLNINKLYAVDHYEPYIYLGEMNYDCINGYEIACKKLSGFDNVELLVLDSIVAADVVPDGLDFVYYDASPDYDVVIRNLGVWFPKLVLGGVIGGRGVTFTTLCEIRAVIDFCDGRNDCVVGGKANEWWIKRIKIKE